MSEKVKQNISVNCPPALLQPGSVIGILGSGQLGRMLALAAARLGLQCHIYSNEDQGPAVEVAAHATQGGYDDYELLDAFAAAVDVITYEFENVPVSTVRRLSDKKSVYPPPGALEIAQDRLVEKQFIRDLGIAVAPFEDVSSEAELVAAVRRLGTPAILKTRSFGYDGKGQVRINMDTDLSKAYKEIAGASAILEGFVHFQREISVILARGREPAGESVFADMIYDMPVNIHEKGILKSSTVPAPLCTQVRREAEDIARDIASALDYVGILAVELFDAGDDRENRLTVNEIAPRVHNSGHWTMDACCVDQFENHIRAVAGWPLGTTERYADVEMMNLIGADVEQWRSFSEQSGVALHLYGKKETSSSRKMGHINRLKRRSASLNATS